MALFLVGGAILEAITDRNLKERLVATSKIMGIVVAADFDIIKMAKN